MNFRIYVIKPLEAGTSPFVFQAPNELVAIKTLLASTVNLQNGHKLYDYNLELLDTGLSLSPEGAIISPLFAKHSVVGTFNDFYAKIGEYGILHPTHTEEVTNVQS